MAKQERAKHPGVKRLDHVSIVAADPRKTVELLGRLLGGKVGDRFEEESEGFEGAYVYLPDNQARVEVLGPMGDQSFLDKFLTTRGAGVHHITFEVDDVEALAAYMREELGIEPYRGVWCDHEWKQTFVHPKDAGGVLLQFYEWLPSKRPDHPPGAGPRESAT